MPQQWIWDASDYDWDRGPMDVSAAQRAGIVAFTHKATEGTSIRHVHYGDALNRGRVAGLELLGAYMVPRTPGNNGHGSILAQVDYLLSYLDQATPWWHEWPGFFFQVDTEHWRYDDVSPQIGAQACDLLQQKTGRWVIHYAPRWSYGDTIPGDHPLWASSYGANPAALFPLAYPGDDAPGWAPYSGRTPTFLQYGSRLTVGSQPGCDVSAFRGTYEQLAALIQGGSMADLDAIQTMTKMIIENDRTNDDTGKHTPIVVNGQQVAAGNGLKQQLDDISAALARIPTTPAPAVAVDPAGLVAALGANPTVLHQLAGSVVDLLIQIAASAHITPAAPAS